jgi:hypothetical protein
MALDLYSFGVPPKSFTDCDLAHGIKTLVRRQPAISVQHLFFEIGGHSCMRTLSPSFAALASS